MSPSALDAYAECPFRFFASRVLGLGEREEASGRGELSPQARGQVYHAALERFYRTLPEAAWSGRHAASAPSPEGGSGEAFFSARTTSLPSEECSKQ